MLIWLDALISVVINSAGNLCRSGIAWGCHISRVGQREVEVAMLVELEVQVLVLIQPEVISVEVVKVNKVVQA